MIARLVLAAGAGRRFGGGRLLAELDGSPLLEHALAVVERAPLDRTVVVLGANADDILACVPLHGAEPVVCEDWDEGQSASFRCGAAALAGAEAVVVTVGDQLRGDTGARALLKRARVLEVACDGLGSAADIDTPEDLEAVR